MAKTKNKKGEASVALRRRLGEELAQMFDTVGRKLYSDLRERLIKAVAETVGEHKAQLQDAIKEEFGRRGSDTVEEHVADWLDEVVGDSITAVAEDIADDLEAIADVLVAEDNGEQESEDDEGEEEDQEDGEDDGDMEEEAKAKKKGKGRKASEELAESLERIKASALALSAEAESLGQHDKAAMLKVAVADL